jgi:hypothetical protein
MLNVNDRVKLINGYTKGTVVNALGVRISVKLDNGKTWTGVKHQVIKIR